MQIDPRSGRHYANQRFKDWRDDVLAQTIRATGKLRQRHQIKEPCHIRVLYWPGDRRRRDVPGMMDALCHYLEYVGVMDDDRWLMDWRWVTFELDRNPRVQIKITKRSDVVVIDSPGVV